ncbi:glycosyltransferase family 2 protein [Natronomonas salina]|uniref:glycosyltransferase family 2 protein n=1 Tax=Natronomonas salina TaxID=1710540 RepID=UPI0015B56384|nr:glycosyltransferase family 2 protein [Natronomonas salina]QLD89423.1 glycosyltransferase family 2 protein [Natronomonas salina]
MYRNHSVGVVVPAYNEEGFVGEVVDTLPSFVDRAYVVDDRSTDGTWAEILERVEDSPDETGDAGPASTDGTRADGGEAVAAGASTGSAGTGASAPTLAGDAATEVVAIRHEENRGVGGAIKTGYLRAVEDGVDLVTVMGGDGQMDPDQLDALLDPLVDGRADYAKGNRLRSPGHWQGMSRFRLFGNAVLTLLTKVSSGYWELLDPQNGYAAITREALETVDVAEMYEDYGYCNDLLARLNRHDCRVAHVDIPAEYGDEESSISYPSYIKNVSGLLLGNFLWRMKHSYAVGSFHPLVLSYLFGTGLALLGAVATVGTLVGVGLGAVGPAAVLVAALLGAVGVQTLLSAMHADADENDGLEVQIT